MGNLVFNELEISEVVKKGIAKMGFTEATPIQSEAIIPVLNGEDIIAQAPTGTGKTCAFGIPAIENTDPESTTQDVVVLCPTRELVMQTAKELEEVARYKKGIKIVPVYGGQPIDQQIVLLKRKPQIIVATPGRLMDHLRRKTIRLKNLKMLVLDEADEMLNMGFREDLDVILETAPKERQTILFSATMPDEIIKIADKYQKENVIKIRTTKEELAVSTVSQYYCEVKLPNRVEAIARLIDANNYKLCMVFCNTKKKVDEISYELRLRKYSADALHGDMKQMQRDRVMQRFKKGITRILVATDVAARGIDVSGIDAVFNYEIPEDNEYYVHRIGRTGRANETGIAYTFVSGREVRKLRELARYIKSDIKLIMPPSLSEVKAVNLEKISQDVFSVIEDGNIEFYIDYIKRELKSKDVSPTDYAAGILKLINEGVNQEENDILMTPEKKDMQRVFVNLGKLDKMGTRNMIELLKSAGVPADNIGKLDIMEKFSFVEIAKENARETLETLNGTFYKKRKIVLEFANDKKKDKKTKSNDIRKKRKR